MNSPLSGSRWEPAAGDATATSATSATSSTVAVEDPAPPPRRRRRRRLVVVVAIVAGVLAVGGAGAAAIGHAVAGFGGPSVGAGRDGVPLGGRDGHHHGPDGAGAGAVAPGDGPSR